MTPKTVLITGGATGIGKATALLFVQNGFQVAVSYRTHQKSAEELQRQANIFCQQADLTNLQQVQQLVTAVQKQYGTIDILINNAGIALKQDVVTTASCEDFNRLFNVNMKGPFLCTNEVLPGMIRQKRGSIVNIASIWGVCGASCEVLYSASKAAVIGYTKALAKEVGPSGIRVNAIAPGLIDTEMNQHLSDLDKQTFAQELPLERIGTPQDVAEAVFFLAGDHAGYITGQVLNVDGGYQI